MRVQFSLQTRLATLSLGDLWLAKLQVGPPRSDADAFDLEMDENTTDELVAVKRFSEQAGPTLLSAVQHELSVVQHVMQLGPHRNIVRFFSTDTTSDHSLLGDSHAQIAMEFCAGGDLYQLLANQPNSRMREAQALDVIAQVAAALAFLHERGITHGNLGLENVLIDSQGVCKLSDFRLARCHNARLSPFVVGDVFANPDFLPPEMNSDLDDTTKLNPFKADIWALGVMLFVLVTGMTLVNQGTNGKLAFYALQTLGCEGALRVWGLDDLVSPETTIMLDKLIAVDPTSRFSSMQDVVQFPVIMGRAV